jgi:hypothetical protein
MIHTFIISHERIFPIEKRCKVLSGTKKLLSMEADPFHTENKELGLLKKKRKIYFDSKQRYGSPRITGIYFLGTKLSRIPVAKHVQELGLRSN